MAMIYNLETTTQSGINLKGAVTQFKVNESIIGIVNQSSQSIIIRKKNNKRFLFNTDNFILDSYGKHIFFIEQDKLYQYTLSDSDTLTPSRMIPLAPIQKLSGLHLINNQFLLINKNSKLWYDVFDVNNKVVVKSIKYDEFPLVYVGKRFIIMADSKCTLIMG